MATAILSALAEEQAGLIEQLDSPERVRHAGRDFWLGRLHGQPVVLALSRIGKVAAATTATALIERFAVERVLFTGVAGGLASEVRVGDLVLATGFVQHDLDVSPLYPRFQVPFYGRDRFECDEALKTILLRAINVALAGSKGIFDSEIGVLKPTVHTGLLASGDRFVSSAIESFALQAALRSAGHEPLAVEMEGAAVAQVCFDFGVPLAAVRTISDRADDNAHVDFPRFVLDIASRVAREVVKAFLEGLPAR
ncbi:MAG: 5'-methylthioadenosine/adenosylhomocysteine nucleosidase [Burkholderiales bacterium]